LDKLDGFAKVTVVSNTLLLYYIFISSFAEIITQNTASRDMTSHLLTFLQGHEDWGSRFFGSVGKILPDFTASHSKYTVFIDDAVRNENLQSQKTFTRF